MKNMLDINLSK